MSQAALTRLEAVAAERPSTGATRELAGIRVAACTGEAAARLLSARLDAGTFTPLAFLNAHCVNLSFEDEEYRRALADFFVLPDGIGVDLASQLLYGEPFPENLNGTDFIPYLLRFLKRPLRVALIGSEPGIVERAARRLAEETPRHLFLPISHGYFAEGPEADAVLERLRRADADIVLVALSVPRQELFIARHLGPGDPPLAIAVGAFLDFTAGKMARAPFLLRQLRLEWVFRLVLEPRRLWRRYILGNPTFMMHMMREKRQGR